MARQRLQKVLASAGVDSRRKCEELILEGSVQVNGTVVDALPAFVDPDEDVITVEGRRIHQARKVYYLLNKPKNVICTNRDPQGRRRAVDLVKTAQRVFCVGRLDAETTGLILLTNDSELANRLTHPRYKVPKTYVARVKGMIDGDAIERLRKGVRLAEATTEAAAVRVIKKGRIESHVQITIRQGLNRQIRRMLARVGLPVRGLKRTKIGRLDLRGLGVGSSRPLTATEVTYLKGIAERSERQS